MHVNTKFVGLAIRSVIVLALGTGLASTTLSQTSASDSAADDAYASWKVGDNGGKGFGPWVFERGNSSEHPTNADAYVNSGASNEIKSPPRTGRAWALKAEDNGSFITAYRPFLTPVPNGGAVEIAMDNGVLTSGDTGVAFANGVGGLVQFYALAAFPNYQYRDFVTGGGELVDTKVARTTSGIHLKITQTNTNTYDLAITPAGGKTTKVSGSIKTPGQFNAIQLSAFNLGSGPSEDHDTFFNNLKITYTR